MNAREAVAKAEEALEDGDLGEVLRLAQVALDDDADSIEAWELRAVAHAERGDVDEADDAAQRLRDLEPDNPGWALLAADTFIRVPGDDEERIEHGLDILTETEPLVREDDELMAAVSVLFGVASSQLGDLQGALNAFNAALKLVPDLSEAQLERAITLFELGKFSEAKPALSSLASELDDPAAHHYLGLMAERRGETSEAQRRFALARKLGPDEFPAPVELSPAAFDEAVKAAVEGLPAHAKPHLNNVVIATLPFPPDEMLQGGDVTPTVLGLFEGTAIDERLATEASHHQTARITLFQNNLQRSVRTHQELLEEIRITVLHEVGHLLGLDEDELYQRGLE